MKNLLEVKNLKVEVNGKEILKGVDLKINTGETQALLGPNASGKSTLAQVVLGSPQYKVTQGQIFFQGKEITRLAPEKRAKLGIALAFQNPPSIKGVKLSFLLERIKSARGRSAFGGKKISSQKLDLASNFLEREINVGFSGGEKKISELLQILSLNPKLAIFDEIDSGLDLKRAEKVAKIIKGELIEKKVAVFLITHSGKILEFLKPALTNVMVGGKIICQEKDYRKVLATIKKYGYEKCKKCPFPTEGGN